MTTCSLLRGSAGLVVLGRDDFGPDLAFLAFLADARFVEGADFDFAFFLAIFLLFGSLRSIEQCSSD